MKTKHLEIKDGNISIPIYAFTDGRYCVDTVLGGKRKRITRASLDSAKIEARRLLAQIGSGRQAEELLSISEAEDYRLAKEKLAPHGVTLLTAVEEWIGCCWRCCRSSSISFIYVPTPPLAAKKECTLCGWSQKLTGKLTVEEAELRTLEKTIMVIGQIEAIPSRSSAVTSRIAGRVLDIKATEGERVKKGQPLVEIESRQVGNPPPRVTYDAPIDGVITHRDVLLNDSVEPDKHLLEIVDMSVVYAEGRIFEGRDAPGI